MNEMKKKLFLYSLAILFVLVPAIASANESVTFTEESSTVLTATIGTVINFETDRWIWEPENGSTISLGLPTGAQWAEPDNSGLVNVFTAAGGAYENTGYQIVSDAPYRGWGDIYANGETVTGALDTADASGTTYWDVTFTDNGDTSCVPEPSSILLMVFLLAGLAAFRLRSRAV